MFLRVRVWIEGFLGKRLHVFEKNDAIAVTFWALLIKADKDNFVSFVRDLRAALDGKGKGAYTLSIACAAGQDAVEAGYDIPGLAKYIDFFNVMTYVSE